jgi:ferredoxin-type protein NapH
MKTRIGSIRHYVRLAVIILIVSAAFFGLPIAGCCYMKIGYLRLICPIGFLEVCLATHRFYWTLFPAFLAVFLILFLLGRFFCSWVCPASFLGQQVQKVAKKILPRRLVSIVLCGWRKFENKAPQLGHRDSIALMVGAFIGIFLFGYPFISLFCPIGVISRNIIELFIHFRLRYDLALVIIPLMFGLFFTRTWKSCCPIGTLRGLEASFNRTFIPVVDHDLCKACGKCQRVCPFGLNPQEGVVDTQLCVKCLQCIDACPQKAIRLAFFVHGNTDRTAPSP